MKCIADLLHCSEFASRPVETFIPSYLACVKGNVGATLSPAKVCDIFSDVGATAVYRCSQVVERSRVPAESVIVTFAGKTYPGEIKAWPLIYRVDPLKELPMQCKHCWHYRHVTKSCKSAMRCSELWGCPFLSRLFFSGTLLLSLSEPTFF